MKLSSAYTREQDQVVRHDALLPDSYFQGDRYTHLRNFCRGCKKVLSIGCGSKEPSLIGATHACDIPTISGVLLRKNAWLGEFKVASADALPYPKKFFDAAVCSEVIEHMLTEEDIKKAMLEIDRVSKKWVMTTPNVNVIPKEKQSPHHIHFFTPETIKELAPFPVDVETSDWHIYITKK